MIAKTDPAKKMFDGCNKIPRSDLIFSRIFGVNKDILLSHSFEIPGGKDTDLLSSSSRIDSLHCGVT